ncbi:MAG: hypothetical protein ACR2P1_13635 [Pseudomonadales bacterium]
MSWGINTSSITRTLEAAARAAEQQQRAAEQQQTAQPAAQQQAASTASTQELQQQISTLQAEKTALQTQNAALQAEKAALQAQKKGLEQVNAQLLGQVNALRQQSAESTKDKEVVTKVLNLAVQVMQEADTADNKATAAKSEATDLLKQAKTSAENAKTSAADSKASKAVQGAHEKAKTAKTNVVRKATAVQTASKKIKDLANEFITGKSKIDDKSEAKIKKEQTELAKDSKALAGALTALKKEVNKAATQVESVAKQVVQQATQAVAPGGGNWNVIAPLFGFQTSAAAAVAKSATAGGGSSVDNWDIIGQLFGFATPTSAATKTTASQRPVNQFQERFRAVNDIAKSLGFGAGFPNFHQADYGKGFVYGTIFVKPEFVEWKDISAKDLGNPSDDAARFRAIHDWAGKNGFATGFPNFHQANPGGKGVVYGAQLLKAGAVEWKDIPAKDLGNPSDDAARFRATYNWATKNGYVAGFPNFHQANPGGKGVVHGTLLLKKEVAEWRDILAADLSKT